jgi:hypothetical protein
MAYGDDYPEMAEISTVGTPWVVQVVIDLQLDELRSHPPIVLAAAQMLAGDHGGGSEVFCMHSLGLERIEAIHHPGGDFWDHHVRHSIR